MKSKKPYDIFLSYASSEIDWVDTLHEELRKRGIRVFQDRKDLAAGQAWVGGLSDAVDSSRFLAVVLTEDALTSPWVLTEWTSHMAQHGPIGRVVPIRRQQLARVPAFLAGQQYIDGLNQSSAQVAEELSILVGDPERISDQDSRRPTLGSLRSLEVGQQIRDPQVIQIVSAQLEKLQDSA